MGSQFHVGEVAVRVLEVGEDVLSLVFVEEVEVNLPVPLASLGVELLLEISKESLDVVDSVRSLQVEHSHCGLEDVGGVGFGIGEHALLD